MVNQGWAPEEQDDLIEGPAKRIHLGIGMISGENAAPQTVTVGGATKTCIDSFCKALGSSIGIAVRVQEFGEYQTLLRAINQGYVDLAWLPPLVALRSASAGKTLPIALPIRNKAAWYASALFARKGSSIAKLSDLSGAKAAWVDPQSTAGYLVIRAWMRSQNVNFGAAFSQQEFLGSHQAVVRAVLSGAADVGATYAHLEPDLKQVRSAAWGDAPAKTIGLAGPIPNDVLSASIRLPVSTIRNVRDALVRQSNALRVASAGLFNSEGFIAAETEHMLPLMKVLEHLEETGRRATSEFPSK